MRETGGGGHAEEFIPGLSLKEQARLLPAQKPVCDESVDVTLAWKSRYSLVLVSFLCSLS